MASTPEKKIKDAVVKVLKEEGVYYFFPLTYGMGRSGVPDIICCVDGYFLGIECKAEGGRVTALQLSEIDKIKKAGGEAVLAVGSEATQITIQAINALRSKDEHRRKNAAVPHGQSPRRV